MLLVLLRVRIHSMDAPYIRLLVTNKISPWLAIADLKLLPPSKGRKIKELVVSILRNYWPIALRLLIAFYQFAGSHPADAGRKCFPLYSSGHAVLLDSDYIKGPSSLLVFSILLYFSVRVNDSLFAIMKPMSAVNAFLLLAEGNLCVSAAPLEVYDPPVLTPNPSTVWTVGHLANITW